MPDRIIEPVTRKALQMSVSLDLNGMSQEDALNRCAGIINAWVRDKYGRIFDIPEKPGDLSDDLLFCGIDTAFQKKRYCLRAWEIDEKEPYRVWLTESEGTFKILFNRLFAFVKKYCVKKTTKEFIRLFFAFAASEIIALWALYKLGFYSTVSTWKIFAFFLIIFLGSKACYAVDTDNKSKKAD